MWDLKDLCIKLTTSMWIVHNFITSFLITKVMKLLKHFINCNIQERCSISFFSPETGNLTSQTLYKMTDCHTRRNTMRINDKIRYNSLNCKRHVFLTIGHTNNTFLTVSTSKFITNLWASDTSCFYFCKAISMSIF